MDKRSLYKNVISEWSRYSDLLPTPQELRNTLVVQGFQCSLSEVQEVYDRLIALTSRLESKAEVLLEWYDEAQSPILEDSTLSDCISLVSVLGLLDA